MIDDFTESQINNLIEFIELNFIDVVRKDQDIDNIDYIIDMMNTLIMLRKARWAIQSERLDTKYNGTSTDDTEEQ